MTTDGSTAMAAAPSARQAQGARSREEILDAAEHLMGTRGYAATSVSALAKESGLPASSIYWHFGSKSGVLGAVMDRASQRFFTAVDLAEVDRRADPRDRLRALLEISLRAIRAHPQFLRLLIVLLLGAEGDHAQDEVVARVRAKGAALLPAGVRLAYAPWGPATAERVGDRLGDLALAVFDGLFVAVEAAGDAPAAQARVDRTVEVAGDALHLAALQVREP